ncbi:MAG: D-alanyl-D-alanine carboxypeptidase [Alphaproteobacteria bacterium]|nr:D-alanyl-D-alanine carboxypeptidase [Alphaproteobacteria bacterium]
MKKLLSLALCLLPFAANAEFKTTAHSAFLIDPQSGTEIVAKEADTLMPPSSMLKLMTLAVVFDEIKAGKLKLDERIVVPDAADYKNPTWATASKICLVKGQKISVRDAVLGLIVMSGGDACVTMAEKVAGSEPEMVRRMTQRAREIGMARSTFGNVSGLPHPDNLMTSRELATLAQYFINRHADLYPMFATKRFEFSEYQTEWCAEWGRTKTLNYNKLLFIMPGAEGLKTGNTAEGGYGLVASATQGGRRLVGVINGFKAKNHDALAAEMKKLLQYGFTDTINKTFYKPGDTIVEIPVWYGRRPFAVATVEKPFVITLPVGAKYLSPQGGKYSAPTNTDNIRILARYAEPLPAPIRAGDKIGLIIAQQDGKAIASADLVAKERVGKVQFFARIWKNLQVIFGIK